VNGPAIKLQLEVLRYHVAVPRRLNHFGCFLLFLAFGPPRLLTAQVNQFEGKKITVIQFQPVRQPLEGWQIQSMLPLKIGQPLRMAEIRAAIQRLFASGTYEDIQVAAEPYRGGVAVRFITRNSWFIGHVSVTGNLSNPPGAGQLANASGLELGQPFKESQVEQSTKDLKRLLDRNGLFEGSVQPFFDYDPQTQQVHIRFEVESGRRARFTTPELKGALKASPEDLIDSTGWRRWLIGGWRPITQSRVLNGLSHIRDYYEKQNRLEAKVALDSVQYDADSNRGKPVVNIDAGPQIELQAVGAKVPTKTLKRYVPVYEEHAVDHDLLVEGARNLRDYFQSRGFFEADVEFKQQRLQQDKARIDYLINRGKRHKLAHLEITGNRYFRTEDLRERMFLVPSSFIQFRHGRYSEAYLRRDEEAITNLYRANGFRDVRVTSKVVDDYRGKAGNLAVFIHIEEGPQWFVASLAVEGIERLNRDEILAMLSSSAGQPFSESNVAIDRDTLLEQYFTRGFPNATFEWSMRLAAQPYQVDLRFEIKEGEQKFVRQVLVSGLNTTKPELVNRNLNLNPGDPLSPTRMRDTQRRLYDLGVFAKVDTAVQNPDGETQHKYVLYDMEEARRFSIATGFGAEVARIGGPANSLEAPGGQTGFAPRVSFDISRLNLWGSGQTITFRSRASTLERRGLVSYLVPRFRNAEGLQLSFTALYDDTRDVRTFSSKRQEGSVQLSQRVSKATTIFYRYAFRRVSVTDVKISPLLIPLVTQPVRVGILSVNALQDRRDDPIDTHRGIYNTIDLGLAERAFGSQRNFLRFLGRNSTYHPLSKKLVLARSTSFGVLHPFRFEGDALQAIPLAERFFSGGATSNRGFPENQAGPRDEITGFPLGGTALLMNQTELRFPLIGDNISGVLFHDAGNTYSSLEKISFRVHQRDVKDFDYMVHGVGFGLRYRTPIGPVRVDLAYSLNPPRFFGFKGTLEDLINAGVNPCQTAPGKCVEQGISHFQFFFSIGQTF